jgi:hypothetical protein
MSVGRESAAGIVGRKVEGPNRLIHASFRPRLAATPLRFSSPSPPPGWAGDFHPKLSNLFGTQTKRLRIYRSLRKSQFWIFLQRPHVLGLQALRSLRHLEFHTLPFLQAAEAAGLDCGEMHEDILATLAADKTISLGVVKPLYCSLFHILVQIPFSEFLRWKESEGTAGQVLAEKARCCSQPILRKRESHSTRRRDFPPQISGKARFECWIPGSAAASGALRRASRPPSRMRFGAKS